MKTRISKLILKCLLAVEAKRPRTVIQHIIEHGSITTRELTEVYGYEHPPRAIRDVRELGIPLVTSRIKDEDGKTIATYSFGDLNKWGNDPARARGRTVLARAVKKALIDKYGAKCFIYLEAMGEGELQVDHRVPYEIGGEKEASDVDAFMLLCPSANRAKSWTCEHCENWTRKDASFCLRCFWAHPENYDHVAGRREKVVAIIFTGDEIEDYERLIRLSGVASAQATIKRILHEHLK